MTSKSASILPLEIRLFGPCTIRVRGEEMSPLRTVKGQWLLALLALRTMRVVDRHWLATTLWPDSLEEQALSGLRRALTDLRRALGPEAERLQSPTTRTLRLDLTGAFLDVAEFQAAIQRGEDAVALALYRGALLEGCREDWVLAERENYQQRVLSARIRSAEAAARAENYSEAASHWRQVLLAEPLHEAAQYGLMNTLITAGNSAAAIQVYRELCQRLRQEYNAEPGPQVTALFRQICQKAYIGQRSPSCSPALTAKIPLETETTDRPEVPRRLPRPLTFFVGRDREIQTVAHLLQNRRLITLTGMGGIGKTRLAIAIAEHLLDRNAETFPEGAFFADLSGVREGSAVIPTIQDALGLEPEGGSDPRQELLKHLKARRLLLILDNCEHLINPVAELVQEILAETWNVRLLTTSREPLRLEGECLYRVSALSFPENSQDDSSRLLCHEAVQLFIERAEAVQPEFTLSPSRLELIARICARLDGIALAIELATARLSALSLEQIAARLDNRLHLLTVSSRTARPRQCTLRAALDWSHDLLTDSERTLFRRLSVFAGGFTPETAQAVCLPQAGNGETLELLTTLVDKSLVVPTGEERFRLLETVREYGISLLTEAGELEALQGQFARYFGELVKETASRLGRKQHRETVALLVAEEENIRAALKVLLQNEETVLLGQQSANTMARFWTMRNSLHEALRLCEEALNVTPKGETPETVQHIRLRLCGSLGIIARRIGDYARATAMQEESLALAREIGDADGIAAALGNLALIAENCGEYERSQALREEGLTQERMRGDQAGIAIFLHNYANIAQRRGDLTVAFSGYQECAALQRAIGNQEGLAWTLAGLCHVLIDRAAQEKAEPGDSALFQQTATEGLALMQEFGDKEGMVEMHALLARWHIDRGEQEVALPHLREALSLHRTMEGNAGAVGFFDVVARAALAAGMASEAALLLGAENGVMVQQGTCATPAEWKEYEALKARLGILLGTADFAEIFAAGQLLSVSDALTVAERVVQ